VIALAIIVAVLVLYSVISFFEIRRINIRSQEINAAFKAFLIADLDCHWKDSAERLLKVLERE
jgi:CHASE3 domain sensor protein